MRKIEPPFEISYNGNQVQVSEHSVEDTRIFRISLPRPLNLTVAETPGEKKFWTSVPQGRQREAEEIGKLIAAYIRGKNK